MWNADTLFNPLTLSRIVFIKCSLTQTHNIFKLGPKTGTEVKHPQNWTSSPVTNLSDVLILKLM